MSEKIMIKSISDFVNALSKLGECNKDKSRFFRGHSDCCYQLIPSIYREPYLIKNEHRIIQDAFTYCSEYFSENETLFEKLVKLQHYDYKTRLLDITSNALVALYFAIDTFREKSIQIDETKDGEVIILDIDNDEIKYPDSDTVAILSALSLRDANFDIRKISVISKYNLEREKHLRLISEKQILNHLKGKDREYFISLKREIDKLPKDDRLGMLRYMTIREFNSQEHITRLLNDIRKDKPYFLPIIKNEDFNNVLCVRSKFNNQRISRQHGSFLIFGIQNQKTENAVVNPKWVVSGDNAEFRFIIDKNSKSRILDELKFFGISRQTLFPELDSQATQIISCYKDN
ncbi:FRG domain-containing protein [Moraxella catarrhalis]|uniref:FRG domain-containing protein n=1 Tax=Moraxella catarrhalis TaxID=480 RepID=UPI001D0D875A|nr:FRG domain-containing protein [Moraxella catarrhalis]